MGRSIIRVHPPAGRAGFPLLWEVVQHASSTRCVPASRGGFRVRTGGSNDRAATLAAPLLVAPRAAHFWGVDFFKEAGLLVAVLRGWTSFLAPVRQ